MEISLRYVTHFAYSAPVWESHNSLRARPADGHGQRLLEYEVTTRPEVPIFSYEDNWGTHVDIFDVPQQHEELLVVVSARVITSAAEAPQNGPLAGTAEMSYIERRWRFLQPGRHTRWNDEIAEAARGALGASIDVVEIVGGIQDVVRTQIEYQSGVTAIGVDLGQLWIDGVGVCQDFAHLTIAMLRSVGIAARYVSGYFYASDPTSGDSSETDEVVVATHAWVEVAVPDWGWWAIDPTNASLVGERHVKIGHGRDYDDVTPLRGVYYGESDHRLGAEVTMSTSKISTQSVPGVGSAKDLVDQQ